MRLVILEFSSIRRPCMVGWFIETRETKCCNQKNPEKASFLAMADSGWYVASGINRWPLVLVFSKAFYHTTWL